MIIDQAINTYINQTLVEANKAREAAHEPSGKLSASMLFQPTRFQLLKSLGVPRREPDCYALGLFKRGADVEDWFVGQIDKMGALIDKQVKVEYRGVGGFADALVDSDLMQFKKGKMPHECKSVKNAKLKRIAATGVDWHYQLQGCLYALALGTEYFAIDIVSAEDYRPTIYIFQTLDFKKDVDIIISNYDQAMINWKKDRSLPKLEVDNRVKWAINEKYAMLEPFWFTEPDSVVIKKMEELGLC